MKYLFLASLFSLASTIHADDPFLDYAFEQERMKLTQDAIFVVSSFEEEDRITAYSFRGKQLWDIAFFAKIVSWAIEDDVIFVFSKERHGSATFVTSVDLESGKMIWQKATS